MILKINTFLSSDAISCKVQENYLIDDHDFLEDTGLNENISLIGEIFKTQEDIVFSGMVRYKFADQCGRCLKEFNNSIDAKFQGKLVLVEDEESDEIQLVVTDGHIKMDEIIKQMIYLSMPMKSLCQKDCKGLCPNCGINLNFEECNCENNLTDPRFDKLKELLKN